MVVLWGCGAGGIISALFFFGYSHRLSDVVSAATIYVFAVICVFLVTVSASLCNRPRNFRMLLQHAMHTCSRGVCRAPDADAREYLQSRADCLAAIDGSVGYWEEEAYPVSDYKLSASAFNIHIANTGTMRNSLSRLKRYKCCEFLHPTSRL